MSQLEELKRQRKELDAKIKELQAKQQTINCGDCSLRFYNKNYPQMPEQINLSVNRYGADGALGRKQTLFFVETKKEAAERIKKLISDLQSVLEKIK